MFNSVGWVEIFMILVIALIVIGPERLPGVIEDVRAAIYAARRAINNAKKELNGDFVSEFEDFRQPLDQIRTIQRMGPKGAITKVLFDGDEETVNALDPKKLLSREDLETGLSGKPQLLGPETQSQPRPQPQVQRPASSSAQATQPASPQLPPAGPQNRNFSWEDIA
ncbi:twin-arginine translocase TatA/TatE family subunit [Corynebacterium sp. HS2168-gen11]|uniref:twin-arginine translocase TatA/TatE family subunit n=1 Tax=Corynebacterium sp. HS2168-gen11 TaxID=2974027 RepID=UPI00216B0762|nr:twin-arginine translocase TatA/TatE family subunit [Corynebacterium sp. HS2168-gen11]MCS4534912.1 twin-arginine translocase TatA/TatE family subunit [Corynebacterium sp. HS2168-gen11]